MGKNKHPTECACKRTERKKQEAVINQQRHIDLGLLLWGGVGTGKSFLAGCIASALMEQEVPVRMTNFARILNELNSSFSGRNQIVDKLCRYPLLII